MIRGATIGLYSNEHVEKAFFMVRSFIAFYLIQYHENLFHNKHFISVYFILQMELYFPGLVKYHRQISTLGCLGRVAYEKKACT